MTTANRFSPLFKAPQPKIASTDEKRSYTNDFPSLDEAKKVPAKFESDSTVENKKDVFPTESKKKTQTQSKIILGHRSYEEDLRLQVPQKIVEAYELLANKEKLETALVKTRMCNSVDMKEVCKHGDSCRFAHNLNELKISTCLFEDKCRFVKICDGKLLNNGVKICNHKHPQESTEDFMSRVGLDKYNKQKKKESLLPPTQPQTQFIPPPPTQPQFIPSPPTQPQFIPSPPTQPQFIPPPPTQPQFIPSPPTQPQFIPPPPTQPQFIPSPPTQYFQQFIPPTQTQFFQQFIPPPPTQTQFFPQPQFFQPTQPQFVPPPPTQPQNDSTSTQTQIVSPPTQHQNDSTSTQTSTEQILIIRVPKELASQALEIAMKSGRAHIQVEII